MKNQLFFILLLIIPVLSHGGSTTQLVDKGGIKYGINQEKSFTGIYKAETQNNQVEESCYINGKKNGMSTLWYPNGQRNSIAHFKNNKLNGLMIKWYQNGNRKLEMVFIMGEPNGLMTEWYENGRKKSETLLINGQPKSSKGFMYENGIDVN